MDWRYYGMYNIETNELILRETENTEYHNLYTC